MPLTNEQWETFDVGPIRFVALDFDGRRAGPYFEAVSWMMVTVKPRADGRQVYVHVPFTSRWATYKGEGCLDVPEGPMRRLRARMDFENAFYTLLHIFEHPEDDHLFAVGGEEGDVDAE
jgi:hypothetical protein